MLLFIVINIGSLSENLFHIRDMNIKNRLLLSLAYTDILTHLQNRTSFDEMMNALNSSLKQETSIHLIILDVNNLKTINDTYGHMHGDNMLVDSAKILKVTIGQLGEVYRIGGDEFACIIRNAEESVINDYISEMFEHIDSYNSKNEHPKMSIAYGMASYQAELDKDIHSLFVRADKAMYNNKETQKVIQVIG
jgi:diguanylate cyclase (GGDEF)-like protein